MATFVVDFKDFFKIKKILKKKKKRKLAWPFVLKIKMIGFGNLKATFKTITKISPIGNMNAGFFFFFKEEIGNVIVDFDEEE